MRRREFIGLVGGAAAWPFAAAAQAPERIFRIGCLGNRPTLEVDGGACREFREGLRDLGYIEGKNLRFELRFAEGDNLACPRSPGNWPRSTWTSSSPWPALFAARQATSTIPIVTAAGETRRLGTGLQSRPSRRKYHRIDVLHRGTVRQAAGDARGDRSVAGASGPAAAQNQAPRRRGAK